jgi:putative phage-type endonuclease
MTARLLGHWPDRSPEWHAARANRIGGSDVGVIAGLSPYQTRDGLLAEKLGLSQPKKMTAAMKRGIYSEHAVASWLADEYGLEYDDNYKGTWIDADHPHRLYNPDRVTTDARLVEIKTASEKSEDRGWGRAGTGQIPDTYTAQCQWGMGILGLTECIVGVLFGSPFEFRRYRLTYDEATFQYLANHADNFHAELMAAQTEVAV